MDNTRDARLIKYTRYRGKHRLEFVVAISWTCHVAYQRCRVELDALPPSLAFALALKPKLPLDIVVDLSETQEKTGTVRDGFETFTVTTDLIGPIHVVGLSTTIELNVHRDCGARNIQTSWVRRGDGLVPEQRLTYSRPVAPWRAIVDALRAGETPTPLPDSFEQRLLESIAVHAPWLVADNRGGYARVPVELRGLALSWVPSILRDAPAP
jgi:hypothetical protein